MAVFRDILQTDLADDFIVRAGEAGMSHHVSWVYVCQENDIEPWIGGNEILILYGAGMRCDTDSLVALVRLCDICSIAGIIALTGNFIQTLPDAMLQEADRVGLPIVELSYKIPISKITKILANMILGTDHREQVSPVGKILYRILEKNDVELHSAEKLLAEYGYEWKKENVVFFLEAENMEKVRPMIEKIVKFDLRTEAFYIIGRCLVGIMSKEAELYSEINVCAEEVIKKIGDKYQIECCIGIGTIINKIQDLPDSYDTAKKALELYHMEGTKKKIISMRDFAPIMRLLSVHYEETLLMQIVKDELGSLISYDRKHGTELLETLRVFLDCSCNAKDAAEKLYIHRNTIAYRIRQIEKITGYKLSDMNKCHEYFTACFCLKYLLLCGHKMEDISC